MSPTKGAIADITGLPVKSAPSEPWEGFCMDGSSGGGYAPRWAELLTPAGGASKVLSELKEEWGMEESEQETDEVRAFKTLKTPAASKGLREAAAGDPANNDKSEEPPSTVADSKPRAAKPSPRHSHSQSGQSGITERIFGLVPDLSDASRTQKMSGCRKMVKRIITSTWFECFAMVMILLHSLFIGIQINHLAVTLNPDAGVFWRSIDLGFCFFFSLEVAVRLYVYQLRFFTMHGCAWNVLDFVVSSLQLFEEIVAISASSSDLEMAQSSVMRVMRILRGVKVMRLIRAVRYADELQLVVSCLLLSLRTFMWALSLLVMTIYVMAIYVTQAVYVFRLENPMPDTEDYDGIRIRENLAGFWGSLPTSMLSVFQALTGGVDWGDVLEPLSVYVSEGFGALFVVYMAFCYLALMNVITGTFVETVSRQASKLKIRSQILRARHVFSEMDWDHTGTISLHDLQNQAASPAVADFLESVEVDPSEAQYLLEVLDMDGSGTINFEEFLQGTLRLNSSARAADLMLVAREMKRYFIHSADEMKIIKQRLGLLQ
ncbi:CACNA1S [Symbiodinium sp. KB8]|nr:CACNA1S [Symbiodinium sp. KB8]